MGRALGQVFAVMAQAVLSDLDGVEVALRSPLSGQGHTWVEKREAEKGDEDSGASVGSFLVVTFIVLKYLCLHNHLVFFSFKLASLQRFVFRWQFVTTAFFYGLRID